MTPSFSWKPSETPFLNLFARVDENDANEDFDDKNLDKPARLRFVNGETAMSKV